MKNWIIAGLVAVIAIGGAVVFAQSQRTANIEVRVWEDVNDPERNYISARPEGGSWRTLGTIPLPLADGVSSTGRFRYGDITLAVPLGDGATTPTATPTPSPTATPTPTPTPSPTPTPTPTPTSVVCEQGEDSGGPPAVFLGVARIDGRPAERGTTITATVGEVCCATATVRADGLYTLSVPPSCGSPGATVTFTVGGVPAAETGVWRNTRLNSLDLNASGTTASRPVPAHARFGDWRREEVRDKSHVDNPNRLTHIWYVLVHDEADGITAGAPESMALALGCSGVSRNAPRFEAETRGADGYSRLISTFPNDYPDGAALYPRRLARALLTDSDGIVRVEVRSGPIPIGVYTFDVTGIDAVLDDLSCY